MEKLGRRTMGLTSTGLLTIFIFMIGGLTAGKPSFSEFDVSGIDLHLAYGSSTNTSGIYGTVAAIFLFQGSYSVGWTPLTMTYPPEVLNFSIRANGLAINTFVVNAIGLMVTFAFPYALAAIGWKTYMINGAWDVLELLFVYFFWVETKGKTLEEIDELFDGHKHSDVPDLEDIRKGKADIGTLVVDGVEVAGQGKDQSTVAIKKADD